MKKSINIILIGVLTVASLLLALPFTPLRNSFTNTTSKYTEQAISKMGVDLNGKINNARAITGARSYQIQGLDMNGIYDYSKPIAKNGDYSNSKGLNSNSGYSVYSNANLDNTKSNQAEMFGAGFNYSSSKSNNSNSTVSNINIASASTNLASTNPTTTTKQSAQGDEVNGGTHPGVDPTNPPPSLPIGDGMNYMLVLLIVFSGWKARKAILN